MNYTSLRTLAALAGALLITNMPLQASQRDDRIESSFQKTEIYEQNLQNDQINIRSHDGKVTLTGTAANAHHKMLAGDAARSLRGVESVANHIKVAGKYTADSSCCGKCSDHRSCTSTYSNGVPKSRFLSGESPRICSNGNVGYSARQRGPIDHYQTQSDRAITEAIRSAIYDDSSLDSVYNEVTISTVKGHVTLNGEVSTSHEKAEIQAKARETVKRDMIHNQIVVAQN